MLKVIWPAGKPERAECPDGLLAPFGRLGATMVWRLMGNKVRSVEVEGRFVDAIATARKVETAVRLARPLERWDFQVEPDVILDLDRYERVHG